MGWKKGKKTIPFFFKNGKHTEIQQELLNKRYPLSSLAANFHLQKVQILNLML